MIQPTDPLMMKRAELSKTAQARLLDVPGIRFSEPAIDLLIAVERDAYHRGYGDRDSGRPCEPHGKEKRDESK